MEDKHNYIFKAVCGGRIGTDRDSCGTQQRREMALQWRDVISFPKAASSLWHLSDGTVLALKKRSLSVFKVF